MSQTATGSTARTSAGRSKPGLAGRLSSSRLFFQEGECQVIGTHTVGAGGMIVLSYRSSITHATQAGGQAMTRRAEDMSVRTPMA